MNIEQVVDRLRDLYYSPTNNKMELLKRLEVGIPKLIEELDTYREECEDDGNEFYHKYISFSIPIPFPLENDDEEV